MTILFSRPVSGFTADDIEVAKGQVTGLDRGEDGTLWTATMAPDAALAAGASMTIGIAANVVEGGNNPLHAVKMTYIRPSGKGTLVVNAADSGSVRFRSSTPGLDDLAVTAASGGRGVRGPISVPAGEHVLTYTLPLGYSVTAAACPSPWVTVWHPPGCLAMWMPGSRLTARAWGRGARRHCALAFALIRMRSAAFSAPTCRLMPAPAGAFSPVRPPSWAMN